MVGDPLTDGVLIYKVQKYKINREQPKIICQFPTILLILPLIYVTNLHENMKKSLTKSVAALCLTMLVAGCGGNKTKTEAKTQEPVGTSEATEATAEMAEPKDSLQLVAIDVEQDDTVAHIKYCIHYPVSGEPAMVNALRQYIAEAMGVKTAELSDGKALIQQALTSKYAELKAERDEMQSDGRMDVPPLEYECDIVPQNPTDHYITLSTTIYEYHGGPHGSTLGVGTSFSKADGRKLGYNLLKNTGTPAFMELVKTGLKEYFTSNGEVVKTDSQLFECLLLPGDLSTLPLPAHDPWLTDEGFLFSYQQYEIAPYAAGMPSFVIDYDKIAPYLTDEAKKFLGL